MHWAGWWFNNRLKGTRPINRTPDINSKCVRQISQPVSKFRVLDFDPLLLNKLFKFQLTLLNAMVFHVQKIASRQRISGGQHVRHCVTIGRVQGATFVSVIVDCATTDKLSFTAARVQTIFFTVQIPHDFVGNWMKLSGAKTFKCPCLAANGV